MSKVVIQGNASGTGDFTIAAPNSNTDRTLTLPDEAGTVLTTSGVPSSAMPAGSVVQTVHTTVNGQSSHAVSTNAWADVTGLSVSITPLSSSSKILVFFSLDVSNPVNMIRIRLVRNSTPIAIPTNIGSRNPSTGFSYQGSGLKMVPINKSHLDSPATTSSTTYKIQIGTNSTSTLYVGMRSDDSDSLNFDRSVSSITLLEIAA